MRKPGKSLKSLLSLMLVVVMIAAVFQGGLLTASAATGTVNVENLQVEYVENPVGIDVETPHFSWNLQSDARGIQQSSFRVLVAADPADLAAGPYVWDSGVVNSDKTVGIPYAGPALKATTRYFWTVKVETNVGAAVCDMDAYWETGFMDETMAPWDGAEWITDPAYTVPDWDDIYSYTIEYDFKLTPDSSGCGFVFGNSQNGSDVQFLMWQISANQDGVLLRPNRYSPSGAAMADIDVSNIIPNTAEGKSAWYTMRIAVTGDATPGSARISTYLGAVGAANLTEVDANRAVTGDSLTWLLGKIGFYADPGDDAYFTNFKVWNNTDVPSAGNSDSNRVFFENFGLGNSEMFPSFTPEEESGINCIRVNSSKITGPFRFASVNSAGTTLTGNEGANQILTDNQSSKWCNTSVTSSNAWFVMDAGAPVYAAGYAIRGANDDASYTSRYLHTWIVQGSNSASGPWTTISAPGAQGTGWSGNYHLRTFDFDNANHTPYQFYRLQITRRDNSENGTALSATGTTMQFSYFGLVVPLKSIVGSRQVMYPTTPLGLDNEPLYRKEFTTGNKIIKSARLYATAKGYYEFSLNGEKVGDRYLAPGWSDYFHTIMYQTYDVTDMLNENGANVIGAMTGKGWYSGPHQMMGSGRNAYNMYGSVQSLLGKLVITYEDDTQDVIVTDTSWQCNYGPIVYADNYKGEGYDARVDRKGWNDVGYADLNGWFTPITVDFGPTLSTVRNVNPRLVGQIDPPVREVARFTPVDVTPAAYPERRTYNLGQNIAGFLTLTVKGKPGDKITIKHAEMLNTPTAYREGGTTVGGGDGPIGTIYRASLRDTYVDGQVAVNTYTLKGDPNGEEWTPRFTFHGFQYFEITANNFDITDTDRFEILDVEAIAISSDNDMLSAFESSHAKVNKLYSNIVWGMLGNQVGLPTDCPNRDERLGYTGDTQIFSNTATYLQNADQFYAKWLRDLRDYQSTQTGNVAGLVPVLVPNNPRNTSNFSAQWSAGWSDAATTVPWHMYQMYGDEQIIWDSYASMKAYCDFLMHSNRTTNYLRNNSGATRDNNYGDWVAIPQDLPNDYKRLTSSMFMAYSHKLFAQMARVIGDPYNEADTYETTCNNIVNAIKAQYLKEDGRLVHTGGTTPEKQTAYAMMIYFGLDESNNARYAQRLSELVHENGGRLSTGFIGVAYLNPALSRNGYTDTAYTLLEQENYPSWLYSINQGATTAWERWNSYTTSSGFGPTGMNSFNHYTFGSVGDWLMSGILGIERDESDPANVGFRKFILNPQVGGTLTYAKGHYDSISGRIESDWIRADSGAFTYKITVPANTTATVYVPYIGDPSVISHDGGQNVTYVGYDAASRRAEYKVDSGSYVFNSMVTPPSKTLTVSTQDLPRNLFGARITFSVDETEVGGGVYDVVKNIAPGTPAILVAPGGSKVSIKAVPSNPYEFAFEGWYDGQGQPLPSDGNVFDFTITDDAEYIVKLKDGYIYKNILNTILMPLDNTTLNSRITTTNENSNSGEWSRRNLINGNLIAQPGDKGWTSATFSNPTITFNLGSPQSINRIQLYPRTDTLAGNGDSPTFPVRFTIQLSNNSSFSNSGNNVTVTVVDYSGQDYPQPPAGCPAVFVLDQTYTYQYMRLSCTVTGPNASDDSVIRMQLKQFGAYFIKDVTVENGSGSGTYDVGTQVTVTADAPPTGSGFAGWEVAGLTLTDEQRMQPTLTFDMPGSDVTLTATYDEPEAFKFNLPQSFSVKKSKTYDFVLTWSPQVYLAGVSCVSSNAAVASVTLEDNAPGKATFRAKGLKTGTTVLVIDTGVGTVSSVLCTVN